MPPSPAANKLGLCKKESTQFRDPKDAYHLNLLITPLTILSNVRQLGITGYLIKTTRIHAKITSDNYNTAFN